MFPLVFISYLHMLSLDLWVGCVTDTETGLELSYSSPFLYNTGTTFSLMRISHNLSACLPLCDTNMENDNWPLVSGRYVQTAYYSW